MKVDPREIIKAHRATYVDVSRKTRRWQDHALFEFAPMGLALALPALGVQLSNTASTSILAAAGLLIAFFFAVMILIADRAMAFADSDRPMTQASFAHARLLRDIAANASYAALVSIIVGVSMVVVQVTAGTAKTIVSGIALAATAHLVLVLLMVLRRMFVVIDERLTTAETDRTRKSAEVRSIKDRWAG